MVGTLSLFALPVTLGLLAFAPLGSEGVGRGMSAGLLTAVAGGVIYALLGRTSMPAVTPSSATSLILAGLVAKLCASPALLASGEQRVALIFALCALTVTCCGIFQIVLALLGLARLVRFVPQPVVAGFMNGVAVLILLSQMAPLLGLPMGASVLHADLPLRAGALLLGASTLAVLWIFSRRWPRAPAALVALACGTLAYAALMPSLPPGSLGAQVGTLALAVPWPDAMAPLFGAAGTIALQAHLQEVLGTALILALIGAMESALNTLSVDQLRNARHEPSRELIALGLTNLAMGAVGAIVAVSTRARAIAILRAGGTGKIAVIGGSAFLGVLVLLGGRWLAMLPLAVLAAIMVTVAQGLFDQWSRNLLQRWWSGDHSRDMTLSLGMVALVCGTTVWQGFPLAVALGILLSMLVFIERMNRSLIRSRYSALARPSLRIYSQPQELLLRPLRESIQVFELEGALFFGSGDRLLAETDALPPHSRFLVLDLHRLRAIDETGAISLQQITAQLRSRSVEVHLAGLDPHSPLFVSLRAYGVAAAVWPDADRAIEAAEESMLAAHGVVPCEATPLEASSLFRGLDPVQSDIVARSMRRESLLGGTQLFRRGDPGERLYVLTEGSVSLVGDGRLGVAAQRFVSISPGMLFGETALFDRGGRTAHAMADTDSVVYSLSLEALEALDREHPALGSRLHKNIVIHLSGRLRNTTAAWQSFAR